MSTRLAPRRPAKVNRQYQAALEQEIARVQGRVRAIDHLSGLLVLLIAGLGYVAAVVVLDHFLRFPDWLRQLALAGLGIGAVGYVVYAFLLPLRREVNPYFAARALERSEPETKNALVNWLDLRQEPLPTVIREAVQRQAVDELDQADVEEAIPSRRPLRLFYAVAGLLLVFVALRLIMPEQFGSLLSRALFPFSPTVVPNSTRFELVSPIEDEVSLDPLGDPIKQIMVEPGVPVSVAALVQGKTPDAVYLDYQPTLNEKPRTRPLTRPSDEERRLAWSTTLGSDMVPADGLYFRLRGGDGVSRQYQLVVASKKPPSVADVDVVYHYPRYTARPPKRQNHAPLKAPLGTKVDIAFTADQPVRSATLDIQAEGRIVRSFALTINKTDDARLRERVLTLPEQLVLGPPFRVKTTYTVTLQGKEGKADTSPPYAIDIEEDQKPQVSIDKIGQEVLQPDQKEVKLALNDVSTVFGKARDDVAVNTVRLRLRTVPKEPNLPGRDLFALGVKDHEGPLQKSNGYAPPPTDYQLTLNLTKLTHQPKAGKDAQPLVFQVGDRLELWVEATDFAEPEPNTGESRRLLILLTDPLKKEDQEQKQKENQEQEQQREKEQQEKKKQEEQKDGKGENQANKDPKPGDEKNKDKQPGQEPKPGDEKNKDKQPGQEPKPGDEKNKDKQPGQEPKPGDEKNKDKQPGQEPKPGDEKNKDKQPGQEPKPGDEKNKDKQPGQEPKPGDEKNKDKQPGQEPKPGDEKNKDKQPGQEPKPGDEKNKDKQPGQEPKPGDEKNKDKQPGQEPKPGDEKNKDKQPGQEPKPGDEKNKDKQPGQEPKPGDEKNKDKQPGQEPKPGDEKNKDKQPGQEPKPGDSQKQADDLDKKADDLAKAIQGGQGLQPPTERGNPVTPPPQKPDAVNPEDAARAKDLLLKTFKEKMDRGEIDRDVLKQMNWTEKDAKEFMKQYEAAKDRGPFKPGAGGRATGPIKDGTNIRNRTDAILDDPNAPPSELRDAVERFRRRQAEAGVKK